MSEAERRLAVVAAALAGGRAEALLARTAGRGRAEAVALAGRLAGAPRAARLRALAAELTPGPEVFRAAGEAAARRERAPVAAVLRAIASGAPVAGAPALVRICRERLPA